MSSPPPHYQPLYTGIVYHMQDRLHPLGNHGYNRTGYDDGQDIDVTFQDLKRPIQMPQPLIEDQRFQRFISDEQPIPIVPQVATPGHILSHDSDFFQGDGGGVQERAHTSNAYYAASSPYTSTYGAFTSTDNAFSEPLIETRPTTPGEIVTGPRFQALTPERSQYDGTPFQPMQAQYMGLRFNNGFVNPQEVHKVSLSPEIGGGQAFLRPDPGLGNHGADVHEDVMITGSFHMGESNAPDATSPFTTDALQYDPLKRTYTLHTSSSNDEEEVSLHSSDQQLLQQSAVEGETSFVSSFPGHQMSAAGQDQPIPRSFEARQALGREFGDTPSNTFEDGERADSKRTNQDAAPTRPQGKKRGRVGGNLRSSTKGKPAEGPVSSLPGTTAPSGSSAVTSKRRKMHQTTLSRAHKTLAPGSAKTDYPCSQEPACHKSFSTEAELRKHIKDRHLPRHLICRYEFAGCTETFSSKNEWKRHVLTQHVLYEYWTCRVCNKSDPFSRKDLYIQHARRMHMEERLKQEQKALTERRKQLKQQQTSAEGAGKNSRSRAKSRRGGATSSATDTGERQENNALTSSSTAAPTETPELQRAIARMAEMEEAAKVVRCSFPERLFCPVAGCGKVFTGKNAWDDHMEDLASHLQQAWDSHGPPVVFGGPIDQEHFIPWAKEVGVLAEKADGSWRMTNPLETAPDHHRHHHHQPAGLSVDYAGESNFATFLSEDDAIGESEFEEEIVIPAQ